MKRMGYFSELRRFLYREWIPVTKGTIVLTGIVLILTFILKIVGINLDVLLSLNPGAVFSMPWTIITYPLFDDIISTVFAALWLWFIGGSLERSWGGRRFFLFLTVSVLLTGIAMALVGQILNASITIFGFWLPLVGLTWAWGVLNPNQELLFWGLFPIKGIWLAWIHALLIFATYARFNLLLGLASVSSILLVYLWGKGRNRYAKNSRETNARRHSKFRVIK
jgi:membrane associated rhomboid family serine protease